MRVVYRPYVYLKADPNAKKSRLRVPTLRPGQILAVMIVVIGGGILFTVGLPIVRWQLAGSRPQTLINPVSLQVRSQSASVLGAATTTNGKIELKKLSDGFSYFALTPSTSLSRAGIFTLDIPKLGISNARVVANTNDFDTHIGHLPGTAFPGEVGNTFLTGHSALPAFYSPTNYKTIFTHLPDLNVLDEVVIHMNNIAYRYSIEQKIVVDPSDVGVINPPDPFGKYLTLMTCVPPGLNTKRLIVLARLEE